MLLLYYKDLLQIKGDICAWQGHLKETPTLLICLILSEDVEKPDDIPMYDDDEKMEEAKKEQKAVESQRKLFEGLKFFINREVLCVSTSVGQSETTQKLSHYF